ncbi:MAG: arginine N-succinyltransferase [Porticoccaceae bacterium]|nr:arginine N-succinyltransferase [Porticoccaceae bacterium]MDG1474704.1 arginine N-succinyltransferase [Porticoccaceae bacterium]
MIIVRPIKEHDLDNLLRLAKAAYPGMTTLPPDRDALIKKIEKSTTSLHRDVVEPGRENYLLVMEDTVTGLLVGTAGIISQLGEDDQFYSYKLNKVTHSSKVLGKKVSVETLNLSNHFEGFAEVATLFLDDAYRQKGNGKLLARSRYLFMAQFRQRFPSQVMADLRGYFDENGRSPFWDAIGQHFFDMDFAAADLFGAVNGNQFIADLMPKQPIYVNLLSKAAREVIGRPNDQGRAALAMLEKEGFLWRGQIDIFDGAPSVDTFIDHIATIRSSAVANIIGQAEAPDSTEYLVCGGDIRSFKACISVIEETSEGNIKLPSQTLDGLSLSVGERVRYVAL